MRELNGGSGAGDAATERRRMARDGTCGNSRRSGGTSATRGFLCRELQRRSKEAAGMTEWTPATHRRQVLNVCTFWSPLCRRFYATIATFTSPLPLDITFATSQQHAHLPNRSSSPLVNFVFFGLFTVATLSSPSPLCCHRRHFWVVMLFSRSPGRFASLLLPH